MVETKTKRAPRKRATAANSPIPSPRMGATCGHSGCHTACNVRYCGPTSHPRDYHIQKAAHGARHVWMASVVAGLAIVVTLSVAYTAAQAEATPRAKNMNEGMSALWRKLDNMERLLELMAERQGVVLQNEALEADEEFVAPAAAPDPAATLFPAP